MGWLWLRAAVMSETQASVDSLVRITLSIWDRAVSAIVLSTRARFSAFSSAKPVAVMGGAALGDREGCHWWAFWRSSCPACS